MGSFEPGMGLLFRLGDRGYASPREVTTRGGAVGFPVDEVVRVLRCDPVVCVPEGTRPSGYVTASFQAPGASWLLIDWDAIRLPTGITTPR